MKKTLLALLAMGICSNVSAGLNGPTHHSRANCGNNESISWDATGNHTYCTISDHFPPGGGVHEVNTMWGSTWRSAAVHWGEARPGAGWRVYGIHWEIINRVPTNVANENVTDCSIYDGWWDRFNLSMVSGGHNENNKMTEADIQKLKNIPKGISIVPFKNNALPEAIKKQMEIELKNKMSLSYRGYEVSSNPWIKNLSEYNLQKQYKILDNNDIHDTHLKSNLSFVKLIFPYKGISFIGPDDIIGYSVMGSFIKVQNGWNGISTFFNYKNNVCVYRKHNYLSYGGAAQLNKEDTTFDVAGYPTVINTEGNAKNGFVYSINWYDKEYFNNLDCHNKNFDASLKKEMIVLANRINLNK